MGRGWNTLLKGSLVVLAALSVVSASSQVGSGAHSIIQRRLLADLKQAQEAAGIFVDDAYLFENPIEHKGRRLQQTVSDVTATLSNPTILAAIAGLMANGSTVGGFPGISMNLPGGSNAGYSPTNNSYCIFSTTPQATSASKPALAGPPGALPGAFTCVEGSQPGPNSFVVAYNNATYTCTPSTTGSGRKLMQAALAPALANFSSEAAISALFENVLNAVGLPVWNCVIATTPAGNTTMGQATLAVLNDLGVVAQHFLTYLNSNDGLTYEEDIKNDFVSLTNPLYPSGPRFNFSIDFATVAKDRALFRQVFGFPAPPSPPPPAPVAANVEVPATATTGGTVPAGSTPSSVTQTQQSPPSPVTSQATTGSPAASTPTPPTPTDATAVQAEATMTVFDGYLSNCQVVIGSAPGGDGNFARNNAFQAVVIDGQTSMSMNATTLYNGSASYIIPAAKNVEYAPLTQATRSTAQYCYDIATLLPVYNPIASYIQAGAPGMAGNALTTLAVFGQPFGVTAQSVVAALGVTIPDPATLFTYNALGLAINGSEPALAFMKTNTYVSNLVSSGASLLTNDSSVYASFAIIMNQAIARKISYSPPLDTSNATQGRKLLQTAAPAVDLTNATTVTDIMQIARQISQSSTDASVRSAQTSDLTQEEMAAVAASVADLNAAVSSSSNVTATQLSQLFSQTAMATAAARLANGELSVADYTTATGPDAVTAAMNGVLPGTLLPTPTLVAAAPAPSQITQTQVQAAAAASPSPSSGLSHGGKVALATVFPIVGVIAIVAAAAFFISRRNRQTETTSSTVWYRRPFARSSATQTAV